MKSISKITVLKGEKNKNKNTLKVKKLTLIGKITNLILHKNGSINKVLNCNVSSYNEPFLINDECQVKIQWYI